jgi:hypothetical protein
VEVGGGGLDEGAGVGGVRVVALLM